MKNLKYFWAHIVIGIILLFGVVLHALAGCTTKDKWVGPDKYMHFAGTTLVAGMVGTQTQDPMKGFLWGTGVAIAKEAIDATGSGDCTFQDLIWGVAGAATGAYLAHWRLEHIDKGVKITYNRSF